MFLILNLYPILSNLSIVDTIQLSNFGMWAIRDTPSRKLQLCEIHSGVDKRDTYAVHLIAAFWTNQKPRRKKSVPNNWQIGPGFLDIKRKVLYITCFLYQRETIQRPGPTELTQCQSPLASKYQIRILSPTSAYQCGPAFWTNQKPRRKNSAPHTRQLRPRLFGHQSKSLIYKLCFLCQHDQVQEGILISMLSQTKVAPIQARLAERTLHMNLGSRPKNAIPDVRHSGIGFLDKHNRPYI